MSETTTNPVIMAADLITGPGLYEARCGHIVQITHCKGGWWVAAWNGIRTEYSSDGRQRFDEGQEPNQWQLVRWVGPLLASEPEAETTSEQLAEIEGQATEYTPPEGWRVVRFGEQLQPGDVWVNQDGTEQRSNILQWDASAVSGGRCIRRIKPEPQAESHTEQQIEELRSEVSYVQKLLGESRQRVTHLEDLVGSLRTINEAQEKAFDAAGQDNTALRNQLAAVKAEVVQERLERNRWHNQVLRVTAELDEKTTQCEILQVELDAAQQVPADSPELRQLRADLEQVTRERDQHLDSYQRIFGDLETIRETTKAATVEAIAEWLEPIRAVDHLNLSNEILQHLPQIMRHLTGLNSHAID